MSGLNFDFADLTPVGDPETRSWDTPSTALVYVTECPGSALVIVDDGQLHLERWREDLCEEAVFIDVAGDDPSAVPWGLAIWVGKMHTTETHTPDAHEFDTDMRGTLRALTDAEWTALREFGTPWGRNTTS